MNEKIYITLLIFVTILLLIVSILSLKKNTVKGKAFFWFLLFASLIDVSYVIYFCFDSYYIELIGFTGRILFWNFFSVAIFNCTLEETEFRPKFKLDKIILILAVADSVLLLTNSFHGLYFNADPSPEFGSLESNLRIKIFFSLHSIWIIGFGIISIVMLLYKARSLTKTYKRPYVVILVMALFMAVFTSIFVFSADNLELDYSKVFHGILALIIYYYVFYYKNNVIKIKMRDLVFEKIANAIVIFDEKDRLIDYNKIAEEIFSFENKDIMKYKRDEFIKEKLHMNELIEENKQNGKITEYINGEKIFQISYSEIKEENDLTICKMVRLTDVTEIKRVTAEIDRMRKYDIKTGFYSREPFISKVKQLEEDELTQVCVCVYNVNGMKLFNDIFGSMTGDKVLECVAKIVRKNVPEDTFIARFDGDDTILLFERASEENVVELMEKIKKEISQSELFQVQINIEFGIYTNSDQNNSIFNAYKTARNTMIKKKMLKSDSSKSAMITSLKETLSQKDIETHKHGERSKYIAGIIGKNMKLSYSELGDLELLAVLHDIGKITVPEEILKKTTKLNLDEWEIMKQHTLKGYKIAKSSPELKSIAKGVLCHHERWDGNGYPNGLKGEEIPLISRIVSVVDSFDVMMNERPYKKSFTIQDAMKELIDSKGTQFDPMVVDYFIEAIESGEISA